MGNLPWGSVTPVSSSHLYSNFYDDDGGSAGCEDELFNSCVTGGEDHVDVGMQDTGPLIELVNPWQLGVSAGQVLGKHHSPTPLIAGARPVSSLWCLSLSLSPNSYASTLGCLGRCVPSQPVSRRSPGRSPKQAGLCSSNMPAPWSGLPNQDQAGDVRAVSMHRGIMPSCAIRCNTALVAPEGTCDGLTAAVARRWRYCLTAEHCCSLKG